MSSIEINCEHCGHKVKAPKEAAGRRGKCPFCNQSVYIPLPDDEVDTLDLAPEENTEERQRLEEEAKQMDREILHERAGAEPESGEGKGALGNVDELIHDYVAALKDARLEAAEQILSKLNRQPKAARDAVKTMIKDGHPPADLSELPPKVYIIFLKKLQSSLD